MFTHRYLLLLGAALLALSAQAQDVVESSRGEAVERQLPRDDPFAPVGPRSEAARRRNRATASRCARCTAEQARR